VQPGQQVADSGTKSFESGGLNICFRYWRPVQRPLGAVAIVPGFNSHSGYYEWAATN
jgi:alpha-beta hydrolase superfamily lysophospholipase